VIEWKAFYDLEPWGTLADDERIGELCCVIGERHRNKEQFPYPFQPSDFFERLKPRLTEEQQQQLEAYREECEAATEAERHRFNLAMAECRKLIEEKEQEKRAQGAAHG